MNINTIMSTGVTHVHPLPAKAMQWGTNCSATKAINRRPDHLSDNAARYTNLESYILRQFKPNCELI